MFVFVYQNYVPYTHRTLRNKSQKLTWIMSTFCRLIVFVILRLIAGHDVLLPFYYIISV